LEKHKRGTEREAEERLDRHNAFTTKYSQMEAGKIIAFGGARFNNRRMGGIFKRSGFRSGGPNDNKVGMLQKALEKVQRNVRNTQAGGFRRERQ